MKKNKKAICNLTSTFWGTKENREAEIQKTYFYNGENYIKGFWIDTAEKFDLPAVFFI